MITCMLALALQEAAARVELKAEVVALAVHRVEDPDDFEMRPMMEDPGTSLVVRLSAIEWKIIALDGDKSALTVFADDKGTDLMSRKPEFGGFVSSFPKISKDGSYANVKLGSPVLPAKGARAVNVSGTLVFTVARGQEKFTSDALKAEKGTTFELGGIPFSIEGAGKSEWDASKYDINITTKKNATLVARMRLLDADGKDIEFTEGGGRHGMGQRNQSFLLGAEMKQCRVEVTLWKETQIVETPLKVETGLGF